MYANIPPETLAELLLFLNENEEFASLKKLGSVSREELRKALQALAAELKKEAVVAQQELDPAVLKELKEPYRHILSALTPQETKLLLKGFLS
jgi:hypothetical protein